MNRKGSVGIWTKPPWMRQVMTQLKLYLSDLQQQNSTDLQMCRQLPLASRANHLINDLSDHTHTWTCNIMSLACWRLIYSRSSAVGFRMWPSALASLLSLAMQAARCTVAASPCQMYTQEFPSLTGFLSCLLLLQSPTSWQHIYRIYQAFPVY